MTVMHRWKPIELPADPATLAVKEFRAFADLWSKERQRLEKSGALELFTERLARRWSIETGVVERVYDVSMGLTLTLVDQGFEASLVSHAETNIPPEELVQILNDHRESLEMVMDVVGGTRELSVGWIKELHALMTRHQLTSKAVTPQGQIVEIPLAHGTYKAQPNNPTRPDGTQHEYCPTEHVPGEMERLIQLYKQLPGDFPEVRAAWLHHAFTQIHPFQDGNGRVARALASIDFIRAGLFPLLVGRDEFKARYLPALEAADAGELKLLVQYFAECEQRMLAKAISEAEAIAGPVQSIASVLQAARQKVGVHRPLASKVREAMVGRIPTFTDDIGVVLSRMAKQIPDQVPGVKAYVKRSDAGTSRYYRSQVLSFASAHGYWADLREPRAWVRLQLRDGGNTDVVVSLHFVGNPSPGVLAAGLFLVHREKEKGKTLMKPPEPTEAPVTFVGIEPLLFAPGESEQEQRLRLSKWLDDGLVSALAQWTRYL